MRLPLLTALAMFTGSSAIADNWPTEDWQTVESQTVASSIEKLNQLNDYAFPAHIDEEKRDGIRTNGLVIIKDDKLVYERYGRGFDKNIPHLGWSMSKSVINALYGRAVQQKLVDIDEKISAKSDWAKGHGIDAVSYRNALQMASGINWSETYEYAPLYSSVVAMLYTRGKTDMAQFVATQGLEFEPGTAWEYSSGDTNLLSGALKDVVGIDAYPDYPWTALFDLLGMNSSVWEQDQSGTFVGSSYWYATPRDMAKFGYLYLKDGMWENQRLLPQGWVDFSCKMNEAYVATFKRGEHFGDQAYGAQFWLNSEDVSQGIEAPWPNAPTDTCAALGHWRQMIAFIPSQNMVVVRVADDRTGDGKVTNNQILGLAVAAFGSKE